jgi:hypothetical protein
MMSRKELMVVKEYLKDDMTRGFIWQSSSLYEAPCLFAKTSGRGLCVCIDFHVINSKTVQKTYPLPLIRDTLNLLAEAKIYTKLDLRGVYNLVWLKEGEEHKLDFWTRYGLFEPLVMQFGTTNAPADCQE